MKYANFKRWRVRKRGNEANNGSELAGGTVMQLEVINTDKDR